jgi:ADP-ribose pyrophosphatase YjhB (NUDIX family)
MCVISFDRNNTRFNLRVGGAIYRASTVLLQTVDEIDFWVVPGGRVEMLESAEDALVREIHEELGVEPEIQRVLWIVENFVSFEGVHFHEIGLYFLASVSQSVADGMFYNSEPGTPLRLRWFAIEDLARANRKPSFLRERLRHPPAIPEHLIQRDLA